MNDSAVESWTEELDGRMLRLSIDVRVAMAAASARRTSDSQDP